jgi:malonate transporter and related proteins
MNSVLLILPDFLVIPFGWFLAAKLKFSREFWKYAEKLVFYFMLAPLLFNSVARANISPSSASRYLAAAVGSMLIAVVVAWLVRYVVKDDQWTHGSVFQCGFRFNTYIGFALVSRLFGDQGMALLALLIAFWVPISNAIAVAELARSVAVHEAGKNEVNVARKTVMAVIKNPLIIATVSGLIVNVLGIPVPEVIYQFFKVLGSAALAMGLLCIGAGLRLDNFKAHAPLICVNSFCRLVVVPAIACGVCWAAHLSPVEAGAAIVFAVLPTAQSCYVMTAAMRGDAGAVANVTTIQTLASMATIPVWISLVLSGLSAAAGLV